MQFEGEHLWGVRLRPEGLYQGGIILRFQVLLQGSTRNVWEGSRKTTFLTIPFAPKEQCAHEQ